MQELSFEWCIYIPQIHSATPLTENFAPVKRYFCPLEGTSFVSVSRGLLSSIHHTYTHVEQGQTSV